MNPTPDQHATWQQALKSLEISMTKATYDQWLRDTQLNSVAGHVWTIAAQSEAAVDWLSKRLDGQIAEALAGVVGEPVTVEYVARGAELLPVIKPEPEPGKFSGFPDPEENWSKLPHVLIDALPLIETVGELKIILYILRHTWGYHDDEKRISLDEFENGRKRKDGVRIDNGTGLRRNTVKDGIKRAVKHGFIIVEEDNRDPARIKRFYRLHMEF